MVSLRSVFSSRPVVFGLSLLGSLALLISTMESSKPIIDNYKNQINNAIGNRPTSGSGIAWLDANNPPEGKRGGSQPLAIYSGRKPRTVQRLLEDAKGHYDLFVERRHESLSFLHYGTDKFDPWFKWMYWWLYFPAAFNCPHEIQRVGPINDGGKWVCGLSLYEERPRAKCVLYSFGISFQTSFEREMLERTDCEIFAYDASISNMGPDFDNHPRVTFKRYFVGRENKVDADGITWRTLHSLLQENGHDWIDILKVDIEGSEYPAFTALMDDYHETLPFGQLQMEIHTNETYVTFGDFLEFWERLEARGVYPWWSEPNLIPTFPSVSSPGELPTCSEYSFINTRGGAKNLLIQNYE
ncbi:hypothetical protein MVEG_02003 [Podila verticillata NRRL 6337]|nr:hypothetical protein MVEG_02003 [Podila verticillata NRRL 6337]